MSEATGGSGGGGRAEMERRLIERSLQDDAFRQRLLEDPKAAIELELGTPVPAEVQIRVVEETPETIYLVLPPGTPPVGELSDRELDSVAGGQIVPPDEQTLPSTSRFWPGSPHCVD